MVGGGLKTKDELIKNLNRRHRNRDFRVEEVAKINPSKNSVFCHSGNEFIYDVLILCTGVQA